MIAVRISGGKDAASALISDSYLKIVDINGKYPVNNDEFVKWYSTCMKNYFLSSKRKRSPIFINIEALNLQSEETALLDIDEEAVKRFKNNLPLHERILFELIEEIELSYQKIADMLSDKHGIRWSRMDIYRLYKPVKQKFKCLR